MTIYPIQCHQTIEIYLCNCHQFKCDRIRVNSLPNNKILELSKSKAFADDKINLDKILKFVFGRVKNIVGKGETAGYHFVLIIG